MKKRIIGMILLLTGWIVLFPELLYELNICTVCWYENGHFEEYSIEEAVEKDLLQDMPEEELGKIGADNDIEVVYKSAILERIKKKAKP